MKINFDQVLKALDGTPMHTGETDDKGKPKDGANITLKTICVNCLLSPPQNESIDGVEKMRRYQLAKKVFKGGVVNLTAEETAKVKELVGKLATPALVGPAWELLENEATEPAATRETQEPEQPVAE